MDETKKKKPPLDREEFKLLSGNERKFIENPTELLKNYKSPDAMARQYNNQIKYRTTNAIIETAQICEKLPSDRLQKIFSDERLEDLLKITETALNAANWRTFESFEFLLKIEGGDIPDKYIPELVKAQKRKDRLEDFVKNLMPHYLYGSEIRSFEELMEEYKGFSEISSKMLKLESEIGKCLRKSYSLSEFIKYKGLEGEFESYHS